MSKPRIKLTAVVDTNAHADTIISLVRNQLIGKDLFDEHHLNRDIDGDGNIVLGFDFRFNNDMDRDSIKDWIKDQIQTHPQVKNWVQSAKISWHRCTHGDAVVKPCTETEYNIWSKI